MPLAPALAALTAGGCLTDASPLRVLFCLDNLGIGGTELNAVRTAEALDPELVDLSLALLGADGELRSRYDRLGVPIHRFPIGSLRSRRALTEGRRFAHFVRAERIDVVHCHDMYSNVFASVAARAAGVPGILVSRRWSDRLPMPALRLANRVAYRLAGRVLANSGAVAESLVVDEGVRRERVVVVPNFVEEGAFAAPDAAEREVRRGELGIRPGETVIGVVARLAAVKDHASMLRAFAQLAPRFPGLRLALVGDGPERGRLEALAAELGIADGVRFAGTRPHRPNLHHLFEVSALSSVSEGFPNSVVEAMGAARPIVATAVGGTPDAITHEETGLLVPPGDPAALAAGIARMLERPEEAARMAAAAEKRARREFAERSVITQLVTLYEQLSERNARRP